jgi:hypothetical protein
MGSENRIPAGIKKLFFLFRSIHISGRLAEFIFEVLSPGLLSLFDNETGLEVCPECVNYEDICKGPDHDEREGKRDFEPEQGCGMRDAKKTERGSDIQRKGFGIPPVAEQTEQYNDYAQYQVHKKNRIPFKSHGENTRTDVRSAPYIGFTIMSWYKL